MFRTPAYHSSTESSPSEEGKGTREGKREGAPTTSAARDPAPRIERLRVSVLSTDQSLSVATDESYELVVDAPTSRIEAPTVFGALRALETFAQLVERVDGGESSDNVDAAEDDEEAAAADDGGNQRRRRHKHRKPHRHHHHKHHRHHKRKGHKRDVGASRFFVPASSVFDVPRFAHRGTLVDSARHFLPLDVIFSHLDAMEASKMNVLHWHLSDDQAFSVSLPGAPELAAKGGALDGRLIYSRDDVAGVVAAARERGIRVIPELDAPAHSGSWSKGAPEGATMPCYDERTGRPQEGAFISFPLPPPHEGGNKLILTNFFFHPKHKKKTGEGAPPPLLDPSSEAAYDVLWRALRGAAELFPDSKLHVGGDEVDLGCWRGSARVREWAEKQQTETPSAGSDGRGAGSRPSTRDPIEQAFAAFVSRAVGMTAAAGRAAVVWQEAFEAGADLPPTAEVEVWKWWEGRGGGPPSDDATTAEAERAWRRALAAVTAAGHRAILAAPWYLNLGRRGHADWEEMCVFESFSPFSSF